MFQNLNWLPNYCALDLTPLPCVVVVLIFLDQYITKEEIFPNNSSLNKMTNITLNEKSFPCLHNNFWFPFGLDHGLFMLFASTGVSLLHLNIWENYVITSPRLQSGDVLLFYVSFHYYSSTHFCPLDFSEMPWSNFMKPCRNIICHVKLCF